jgi:hypothetical protein
MEDTAKTQRGSNLDRGHLKKGLKNLRYLKYGESPKERIIYSKSLEKAAANIQGLNPEYRYIN